MSFWPKKIEMRDVLIWALWSLIAWVIWSILISIFTFWVSVVIDIQWTIKEAKLWINTSPLLPILFSIITLIWTSIAMFLTYYMLRVTNSDVYKKSPIVLWQIAFFAVLTYFFITPLYIYIWISDYNNFMYIFLIHTMILILWTSIIIEVLSNYRQVLIWIYGSFVGLFLGFIFTIIIFSSLSAWFAKLVSLIVLLPILNFLMTFFKWLFAFAYFYYNKYTNLDNIWDIFYQIEMEEKERLREEEEKNSI